MTATEIMTSIDRQIADLKSAYEVEITDLQRQLVQAKADTAAARDMLEREAAKATSAIQMAAGLVAHFGAVSKIFEDAKTVAERAKTLFSGFEEKTAEAASKGVAEIEQVTSATVAAVEGALHSHLDTPPTTQTETH